MTAQTEMAFVGQVQSRARLASSGEAVSPGAMEKVRAQLPDEYAPPFEAGSLGEMERQR